MVNLRTKFKLSNDSLKAIQDEIVRETTRALRNNLGDLRPIIQESIDDEVRKNKNRFIPTLEEAGELGVGEGGSVSVEKTETAWQALQVSSGQRVTTFSVSKRGSSTSRVFGNLTINIDEDVFFGLPRSIIATPDTDEFSEIPWMEWFVNGRVITEVLFSDRRPIPDTSRTGRGVMITPLGGSGLWYFSPRTTDLIPQLLEKIRLRVNRDLRAKGASILRK